MSKAKAPRVFVPLTKVDETQRLVYGRITQEMLDKSKEVMDYESSKPNFQKWSDEINANSGGLSKGNVRVMHGLTAAGKLTELDFDDTDKAIDVCAKVVDDAEWNKVVEGVYTGFSVGGSYGKRWTDTVDGEKIKKFTAVPNEVSLVDNPCVPSATFSMLKADGTEEAVAFQVENDDAEWPGFAKADGAEEAAKEEAAKEEPVKKTEEPVQGELNFTNAQVAEKATELAKAANDGTDWMSHIEPARAALTAEALAKAAPADKQKGKKDDAAGKKAGEEGKADDDKAAGSEDAGTGDKANKVTPAGVKQVWSASDGTTFEKKELAISHEASLKKGEPTEADKLRARLDKAVSGDAEPDPTLLDDLDRLGKVLQVLETPFENGAPKLEKGMYRVSRFADLLGSFSNLAKTIQSEGKREKDEVDTAVAGEMKKALTQLGDSFKKYTDNQITELLAGIGDEDVIECYDYYCAAAKADPADQLAKDVCSILDERREPSRERREELSKAFGVTEEV
jgi:hypothetical protein